MDRKDAQESRFYIEKLEERLAPSVINCVPTVSNSQRWNNCGGQTACVSTPFGNQGQGTPVNCGQ